MEISLSLQTNIFLGSVVLGMFLGFLFDGIRVTNSVSKNSQKKIFFKDLIYFCLSAVVTFIYMLIVNKGEVRFFIITGEIIGWILYRITIGRFIYKFVLAIVMFIKKWIIKMISFIKKKIPWGKLEKLKKKIIEKRTKIQKKISLKNKIKTAKAKVKGDKKLKNKIQKRKNIKNKPKFGIINNRNLSKKTKVS